MQEKVIFGYWAIRGRGQISRLLLAYTEANWEQHIYKDHNSWFQKDKQGLGLTFPNLPYLIEGEYKITESEAIQSYIIERSNKPELLGKDLKDRGIVRNLIGVIGDMHKFYADLFFDPKHAQKKRAAFQKAKTKLEQLQAYYGEKQFALGYLTLADFILAQTSYFLQKLYPEEYERYTFLAKTREAVNGLPAVVRYYAGKNAVKEPFLPPEYSAIHF